MTVKLVLASSSRYRRELLQKLQLPFEYASPEIDESPLPAETPEQLVLRLAEAKARAISQHPAFARNSLIIGSDQVAVCDGQILGKPGGHDKAIAQLLMMAGKQVDFLTSLALLNSDTGHCQLQLSPYSVYFRSLDKAAITRYVEREQPYDCAGSFKSEGYGITLFERMQGDDPNSLIGLPLMQLVQMLAREGIHLP